MSKTNSHFPLIRKLLSMRLNCCLKNQQVFSFSILTKTKFIFLACLTSMFFSLTSENSIPHEYLYGNGKSRFHFTYIFLPPLHTSLQNESRALGTVF